jgi:hypothetical protein
VLPEGHPLNPRAIKRTLINADASQALIFDGKNQFNQCTINPRSRKYGICGTCAELAEASAFQKTER